MARKKLKVPSLKDIQKKFPGQYIPSQVDESKTPWLPSRVIALNKVMGGGIPFGKILELFGEESSGKSLLAYDFAYCAQYLGGVVLWVDAEQSFTNAWAQSNGLDLDKIVVYRNTSIEAISDWIGMQAMYWRSQLTHNEPILLVLDSMSALDTDNNLNSEMLNASADMGNRAKAIYKYFRIRNEMLYSLGITQIYINQLRKNLKAGMFENPDCLHYSTPICLTNGEIKAIGDIVKNRLQCNVWSFNEELSEWEPKPVIGWVEKDPTTEWLIIRTTSNIEIRCTADHLILTTRGWLPAKELNGLDQLMTKHWSAYKEVEWVSIAEIEKIHEEVPTAKYDLTIEGNHNFLAGLRRGVLVHNTTPGGKALAFYAHQRIGMYGGKQLTKKIKGKERKVGRVTSIRTIKNKVATPGPTLKATPIYNNAKYVEVGLDRLHFLDEILIEEGIVQKSSGGVFSYKGETICRGQEKFIELLKTNDELRRKLIKKADINTLGTTKKLIESLNTNLYQIDDVDDYEEEEC